MKSSWYKIKAKVGEKESTFSTKHSKYVVNTIPGILMISDLEYPEKTTDLSQFTEKLYHTMLTLLITLCTFVVVNFDTADCIIYFTIIDCLVYFQMSICEINILIYKIYSNMCFSISSFMFMFCRSLSLFFLAIVLSVLLYEF